MIRVCCSRRGNVSCLSLIREGVGLQQEGKCSFSFNNQGGGGRKGNVTCPSVIRVGGGGVEEGEM